MKLTGAILAGGQSRRMGRNKALLNHRGQALIEIVRDRLNPLCAEVMVVTRPELADDLAGLSGVRLVMDSYPGRGPLVGIQAALQAATTDLVLVVGCDMPRLQPQALALIAGQPAHWDVVVCHHEGRDQPLHARYSRRCLPAIGRALDRGDRAVGSFFAEVKVCRLEVGEGPRQVVPGSLTDCDTPEDWDRIKNRSE